MKNFYPAPVLIFLFFTYSLYGQTEANTQSVKFANAIIGRYQPNINKMTGAGWQYTNTIVLAGIEKVFEQVKTASYQTSYLNYIKAYVDAYVNADGTIPQSKIMSSLGLDGSHPGLACLFMYQQTSLAKYQLAAKHIRDTLMLPAIGYPKTPEGGFWHRNDPVNYKNVELLDGIYMAQPFLAKYGWLFNDTSATNTAVEQIIILYNHNYNSVNHLINHAFDYDKNTYPWANPSTGVSYEVWCRGMGWYMLSLIDVLKYLPHTHPQYAQLITILNNLSIGIKNYQSAASGLWYCIVDSPKTATKNYIETSGSGMFIYTLKTAIDSGYISSATYLPVVNKAWSGYQTYIKTYSGSINHYSRGPQITSFTPAQGVENNYSAYVASGPVSVPTASGTQHPHGYAATLMAASAMEFPLTGASQKTMNLTVVPGASTVNLFWQNADDTGVDHYEIQKSSDGIVFITTGEIQSNPSKSYKWAETRGEPGNIIYYQVKAILVDASNFYSQIVPFKYDAVKQPNLLVFPNPTSRENINLALTDYPSGSYTIRIINVEGKIIITKQIIVPVDGRYQQNIKLPAGAASGQYYTQLVGEKLRIVKTLFVR